MAISGIGREYDVSFLAASTVKTSTAQFKVVGMPMHTASTCWTVYLCDNGADLSDTICARSAIGIVQDLPSANSEVVTVRMFGLSKALCAESIAAGDPVKAYEGISTTTFAGAIAKMTTSTHAAQQIVLGRAMESGSTNTVITIMVNPVLIENI